jgi:hypothetical protein
LPTKRIGKTQSGTMARQASIRALPLSREAIQATEARAKTSVAGCFIPSLERTCRRLK